MLHAVPEHNVASASRLGECDRHLVAALRAGDEQAFRCLVDGLGSSMLRMAMVHVGSRAVAEEVVQETWIGVLRGIAGFQGRSSLKTWVFQILVNIARTRGRRERRATPFSGLAGEANDEGELLDADRFLPGGHDRCPHRWAWAPTPWPTPEEELLSGETRESILRAVERLPDTQRKVITLHDIEGWPSEEICEALGVSAGNHRVLLHRARTKVRAEVEKYFGAVEETMPVAV